LSVETHQMTCRVCSKVSFRGFVVNRIILLQYVHKLQCALRFSN
jgi:hypothetical protein